MVLSRLCHSRLLFLATCTMLSLGALSPGYAHAACKPWVEMRTDQMRIVSALSEADTRKMAESISRFAQVIDSVASRTPQKSGALTTLYLDWRRASVTRSNESSSY